MTRLRDVLWAMSMHWEKESFFNTHMSREQWIFLVVKLSRWHLPKGLCEEKIK